MAKVERDHPQLSVEKQCALLAINRSSFYYKPAPSPQDDVTLMNEIMDIWQKRPFYGYRKIHATLRRADWLVNRKRVQRLMREMGLKAIYPEPKTSIGNKQNKVYPYLLNGLAVIRPNQVWATDITYIKLTSGFVYLIAIIDLYSRYIVSWRLSTSLDTDFCLDALTGALEHAKPEIFNTDQGCQFTSEPWTNMLKDNAIFISMTGVGRCKDNIRCERLWRSVKYEEVFLQAYESVAGARAGLKSYIEFYNQERVHQSLDYKTPAEMYFAPQTQADPACGFVDNFPGATLEKFPTTPQAQQLQQEV